MFAFTILFFTQDTITPSLIPLIGVGTGVVTVFFIVLAFIVNTFKGIRNEFTTQLTSHKTEVKADIDKIAGTVSSKTSYRHFESAIDGVEENFKKEVKRVDDKVDANKKVEQDHYNKLHEGLGMLISKLIPGAKF